MRSRSRTSPGGFHWSACSSKPTRPISRRCRIGASSINPLTFVTLRRRSRVYAKCPSKRSRRRRRPTSFDFLESRVRQANRAIRVALLAGAIFTLQPAFGQALYERFVKAVAMDRSDEVSSLLARGVDPNTVDPEGNPALVVAARAGFEPTVDALLRAGAKVNGRNQYGDSAIMVAALGGYVSVVKKLLAKGADLDNPGWNALTYAATGGQNDVVRVLLDAGANVNASGPNGTTALMM